MQVEVKDEQEVEEMEKEEKTEPVQYHLVDAEMEMEYLRRCRRV